MVGAGAFDTPAAHATAWRKESPGRDVVRIIATLIIIVLAGLPAVFAGLPATAPAVFDGRQWGAPVSVLVMSALLVVFVVLAAICSTAARNADRNGQ